MARIRSIKPAFFTNEKLSELSAETHLFAAALLCYADDEGYFNANPALVLAATLPLRMKPKAHGALSDESLNAQVMMDELEAIGYLERGVAQDGRRYGRVVGFEEHQRVNRPTASKIAALEISWGSSVKAHGGLTEDSRQEGKGREGNKEGKGKEARAGAPGVAIEVPAWIPRAAWDRFVAMRKKIRAPLTDDAIELAFKALEEYQDDGQDVEKILDASTLNSWRGLFPLRDQGRGGKRGGGRAMAQEGGKELREWMGQQLDDGAREESRS